MFRRLIAAVGGTIAELLTRIMFMGLSLVIGLWIFNQMSAEVWSRIGRKTSPVSIPSIKNLNKNESIVDSGLNQLKALGKTPLMTVPKTREQISRENGALAYAQAQNEIAAFKAHYKKPEICYDLKDHKTRVFCANHFMRARSEWEKTHEIKAN